MAGIWRKARRFFLHHVLHADDTPHRIAVGAAVGIFVGLTPTVGFQMVIAVAIAAALRANKIVCIPMVWITNPVTLGPIYLACFKLGNALVGSSSPSRGHDAVAHIQTLDAGTRAAGLSRWLEIDFWKELLLTATRVGVELWVGCLFVASVAALITYFASRWGVAAYRERRQTRLAERNRRRAARRFTKGIPAGKPSV